MWFLKIMPAGSVRKSSPTAQLERGMIFKIRSVGKLNFSDWHDLVEKIDQLNPNYQQAGEPVERPKGNPLTPPQPVFDGIVYEGIMRYTNSAARQKVLGAY